jgi:peptidoglycan/xylan/chitin deacetylase (PgdA/CDA1 family)
VRLSARGHEIGCHTFEHLDCFRSPADALEASIEQNQAYVQDVLGGMTPTTFSYPYGYYGTAAKFRLQRRFAACRSIIPGVNAGRIDLGLLKSIVIPRGPIDAAWIAPWVEQTQASTGWLILCAHDVSPDHGPYGCTPDLLSATIDAILTAGIEILPVRDALARVSRGSV